MNRLFIGLALVVLLAALAARGGIDASCRPLTALRLLIVSAVPPPVDM